MRIFGIDCGSERTGFGVIDTDGCSHQYVTAGVIRTKASQPFEDRLRHIASDLREVIHTYQPHAIAVEEVFQAINTKSALKLAHVRGVALLVAAEAGIRVSEYSPLEVKMSVAGSFRAEKSQVQIML
jgi:crossover junction endodeoxyribonuclease RuvC